MLCGISVFLTVTVTRRAFDLQSRSRSQASLSMATQLPFKISVLVFVRNAQGEQLLIQRTKSPNLGCWSPIGGKLDMSSGESPYECARRETEEEIRLQIDDSDLHCFGYISEKSYEGAGHWLMFLFDCKKPLPHLPETIDEGALQFLQASIDRRAPHPGNGPHPALALLRPLPRRLCRAQSGLLSFGTAKHH